MNLIDRIPFTIRLELMRFCCVIEPCGSQVICDPPPGIASDYDFLVVIPNKSNQISDVINYLAENEFFWETGGDHYQSQVASGFMSFRQTGEKNSKGGVNLIITSNAEFANKHRLATFVCTRLNVMNKENRKMVFQAILYGSRWPTENAPVAKYDLPNLSGLFDTPF